MESPNTYLPHVLCGTLGPHSMILNSFSMRLYFHSSCCSSAWGFFIGKVVMRKRNMCIVLWILIIASLCIRIAIRYTGNDELVKEKNVSLKKHSDEYRRQRERGCGGHFRDFVLRRMEPRSRRNAWRVPTTRSAAAESGAGSWRGREVCVATSAAAVRKPAQCTAHPEPPRATTHRPPPAWP